MEHWKSIEGWFGYYQVSDLGNVRSLDRVVKFKNCPNGKGKRIPGVMLEKRYDKDGYAVVHLRAANYGKNQLCKVHRLVANAFVPYIPGKDYIDHINGIRTDNRAVNLRWCTVKENNAFPLARKRKSVSTKNSYKKYIGLRETRGKSSRKAIRVSCSLTHRIFEFQSETIAGKSLGISLQTISDILCGRKPNKTNYEFSYIR